MKQKLLKSNWLLKTCIIVALAIIFNACQKNELPASVENFNQRGIAAKVNMYLDSIITATTRKDRKSNLETLKINLQTKNLWVEDFKLGKKFVIIPISESMALKVNKDKPVTSYFVATVDVNGKLYDGCIMQYRMPNSTTKTPMPINELHDFYSSEDNEGIFTYISLRRMTWFDFECEYRDNKPYRYTIIDAKKKNSNTAREDMELCMDYYSVTTWFNLATGEDVTSIEEYMFTICPNSGVVITPPNNPNNPHPPSGGIGGSGGGGTTPPSVPDEEELFEPATDLETWSVGKSPKNVPQWEVFSTENFTGLKCLTNPFKNKIGTIGHSRSFIDPRSTTYPAIWTESGWTGKVTSDSLIARVKISGLVQYLPSTNPNITTYTWPNFPLKDHPWVFVSSKLF